jgi:hypothetical protein
LSLHTAMAFRPTGHARREVTSVAIVDAERGQVDHEPTVALLVSAGTAERVAAAMRVALSAAPPVIVVAGGTSDLVSGWYRRASGDDIALVVLDDDVSVPSVVDLLTDDLSPVRDAVTGADAQTGDLFALAEAFADLMEAPTMLVERLERRIAQLARSVPMVTDAQEKNDPQKRRHRSAHQRRHLVARSPMPR